MGGVCGGAAVQSDGERLLPRERELAGCNLVNAAYLLWQAAPS